MSACTSIQKPQFASYQPFGFYGMLFINYTKKRPTRRLLEPTQTQWRSPFQSGIREVSDRSYSLRPLTISVRKTEVTQTFTKKLVQMNLGTRFLVLSRLGLQN